jgi:hypothetical protein
MFGPERQMTIWTIESDVPEIPVTPAPNLDIWDSRTAVSFAGKGRPLVKREDYDNQGPWRMELTALQALLGTHLKTLPSSYEVTTEDNIALHHVLSRVNAVLAESEGGLRMPKAKVKGKWGHLVGVLPALEMESPDRMEKIDALRREIIDEYKAAHGVFPPTSHLVDQYLALRDAKDQVKQQLSDIELELDTLKRMIEKQYVDEGISSLTTSDGASVGMHYEPHAQVRDNDALREWAIKNGMERLLTLPWPTVNSEVKAALDSGTAVYDGEKLVGGPDGVDAYLITKFQKRGGS